MWLLIPLIVIPLAIIPLVYSIAGWTSGKRVPKSVFGWIIGLIVYWLAVLFLLFTIQNFVGSLIELESTAANVFLLVTGLPGIILMVLAWFLLFGRTIKKENSLPVSYQNTNVRLSGKNSANGQSDPDTRYCRNCGQPLTTMMTYCPECGNPK